MVIGSAATYVGFGRIRRYGARVRVLEVHRFDIPEEEIEPVSLPALIITEQSTLNRFGCLTPTDRLVVVVLDENGEWVDREKNLVPQRDVDFTQLPSDWEEMYRYIAAEHLGAGSRELTRLDMKLLANALGATYLAGARARSRGIV